MRFILALLTLFAVTQIKVNGAALVCKNDFCDPNWTPFDNMVSALRGYNIKTGDPLHNMGDPGFANQIFVPTKINAMGKFELDSGITASRLEICEKLMKSKSFSNTESYRKYITESSSSGVDLQIGTDTEVTADIDMSGVKASAKKTIPKPFERAWSESKEFKEMSSFFTDKQGMVSVSKGTCAMYEMGLNVYKLPSLTEPFKAALKSLFDQRNSPYDLKKSEFKKFIGSFGTHFLLYTKMGAQYLSRAKFSKEVRKTMDSSILENCNDVKGAKVFGISVEKSRTKCTKEDEQKLNGLGSTNVEYEIFTKGSRPTDIEKWTTQNFTPVPLSFKLAPIVNLMVDSYISKLDLVGSDGENVTSLGIRKWFVSMYFEYCKSMDIICEEEKGCGVDDGCPIDAVCQKESTVHNCGNWGQWTCTVNCGQGNRQRRTRTCNGCEGTEQYRDVACKPQKECYNSVSCHWKSTEPNDEGEGKVTYLDRHHLICGEGSAIKAFQLIRSLTGTYKYDYKCCNTPLPCSLERKTTPYDVYREPYLSAGIIAKGAIYLDRHDVDCKNQFLSSFRLERFGGKIRYSYHCCTMSRNKKCYSSYTNWTPNGGGVNGDTVFLDRQRVSCSDNYALTRIRLQTGGDNWRYEYTCCSAKR